MADENSTIPELSAKEREALAFIRRYSAENGYPPTIMELASVTNVTPTGARDRINSLTLKGYLTRARGRSRSIVAVRDEDGNALLTEHGGADLGPEAVSP